MGSVARSAIFGPRGVQLMSAEFGILLAVVLMAGPLVYGSDSTSEAAAGPDTSLEASLSEALRTLREAIAGFREDHGCYPKALAALTSPTRPRTGLDAGGNQVRAKGKRNKAAYLDALPCDPVTGSADTWLYHPLMPMLVDSGGFTGEVTAPSAGATEAPAMLPYWRLPRAAAVRQALGPVAHMVWGRGVTRCCAWMPPPQRSWWRALSRFACYGPPSSQSLRSRASTRPG